MKILMVQVNVVLCTVRHKSGKKCWYKIQIKRRMKMAKKGKKGKGC